MADEDRIVKNPTSGEEWRSCRYCGALYPRDGSCINDSFHPGGRDWVVPRAEVQVKDTNPKDALSTLRIPLWLLSPIAKAHWAIAQFAGLCKYGSWNWRASGVRTSVYLSAMGRHIDAYLSGEEHDPADGTHHLGNIMACAAILLDARAAGKLVDDRPPSVSLRGEYKELVTTMERLREAYKDKSPRHWTIADGPEIEAGKK